MPSYFPICFVFFLFFYFNYKSRIILVVSDFHPWQNGGVAEGAVLSVRAQSPMYLGQASLNETLSNGKSRTYV